MKFISENAIEVFMDNIETDPDYFFKLSDEFEVNLNNVADFLSDENLKVLSEEEFELLWFLAVITYGIVKEEIGHIPMVDSKVLESCDETNWEIFNSAQGKTFKDKLDVFFQDYTQEDLLAMVEDSSEADEEVKITSTGREVIFISSKSIIDAFDICN